MDIAATLRSLLATFPATREDADLAEDTIAPDAELAEDALESREYTDIAEGIRDRAEAVLSALGTSEVAAAREALTESVRDALATL